MGTIISAIFSVISSNNNYNNNNNNNNKNDDPQNFTSMASTEQSFNTKSLAKRKSKPELLIHSPLLPDVAAETNQVVHEFIWKYGAKDSVHLAGSFTDWIPSISMVPVDHNREYWRALVQLDPTKEWQFKFVVDGVWRCGLDLPTVIDPQGFTNNIIKPEPEPEPEQKMNE